MTKTAFTPYQIFVVALLSFLQFTVVLDFMILAPLGPFVRPLIKGIKNVTINEPFFPGHFPGAPVMPGVLQIEALAQTGALLMSKTLEADITKHLIL
ncbi:MAG: hypothetical protein JNM63_17580, partial [Spirochaetia bacterium]|nr:hypothetical protein [Spirochaetia bacterium]